MTRRTTPPSRTKLYLTYPRKLVKEPLIYRMSQEFALVFNIRSASVSEEIGIIALEKSSDPSPESTSTAGRSAS